MVVPVLMTSCQVSENRKAGPSAAHATMIAHAMPNAVLLPVHRVTVEEKCSNPGPNTPCLHRCIATSRRQHYYTRRCSWDEFDESRDGLIAQSNE